LIGAGLLFNGSGIAVLESLHRDYVRIKFSAWKLVYASDMSPTGSFRTATVAGLTEFFDSPDNNTNKAKKQRIFPSTSKVSRERVALNQYAINKAGLTRRETPYGEIYYLDPERVIRLLLKASGLDEIAQHEAVKLAVTSDGANTFHNRTQISIGVKLQMHVLSTVKQRLLFLFLLCRMMLEIELGTLKVSSPVKCALSASWQMPKTKVPCMLRFFLSFINTQMCYEQLFFAMDSYHKAIKLLTAHSLLSDDEIEMFQSHADNFSRHGLNCSVWKVSPTIYTYSALDICSTFSRSTVVCIFTANKDGRQ